MGWQMAHLVNLPVRLTGICKRPELNGQHGIALQFDVTTQRVHVDVSGSVLALRPESLVVDKPMGLIGTTVEICNLDSSGAIYNGRQAHVLDFKDESGRFTLRLSDGKPVAVKPSKVRILCAAVTPPASIAPPAAPKSTVPPPRAEPVSVVLPRGLEGTRMIWSLAYVWPKGSAFTEDFSGKSGRNGPAWYARCIADLITTRSRSRPADSFIVHTHGAIGAAHRAALEAYWRAALRGDGSLAVKVCDAGAAPFLPVLLRTVPVLDACDDCDGHIVVAVDVHDDLALQARELSLLLSEMHEMHARCQPGQSADGASTGAEGRGEGSLGITFYPAIDDAPEEVKAGLRVCHEGAQGAVGAADVGGARASGVGGRQPKRQAVARRRLLRSVLWHVDAGLVASLPEWRKGLRDLRSCVGSAVGYYQAGYAEHAHSYHEHVGLASSHSDELAMHEFLLEGRCMGGGGRCMMREADPSSRDHLSRPHVSRPHPQRPPPQPSQPSQAPSPSAHSQSPPQSPPTKEDWLTEGSELLHQRIARRFGKSVMLGLVVGWLPPNDTTGEDVLYRVCHDDGDVEDLDSDELRAALRCYEECEGRPWMRDYVRRTAVLRSHVLTCRSPARALPLLSHELRGFLGLSAPCYTGVQLARAAGAPDELTPEDIDECGLRGCAYDRCVSESLQWARPACGESSPEDLKCRR